MITVNTGLIENPQHLFFKEELVIKTTEKWTIDHLLKRENTFFANNFKAHVLDSFRNKEFLLKEDASLLNFGLNGYTYDKDVRSDFKKPPIVPLELFLPLLKGFLDSIGDNDKYFIYVSFNNMFFSLRMANAVLVYEKTTYVEFLPISDRKPWQEEMNFLVQPTVLLC